MTHKLITVRQNPGLLLAGVLSIAFCVAYVQAQDVSVTGERPVDKAI